MASTLKQSLIPANALQRLLLVNIAVFLLVAIARAVLLLFMIPLQDYFDTARWLSVPSSFHTLITRPWTLITYMFYHEDFFHILFNMLWLFWMGRILTEYLGEKKLVSVYLLGGLSGALMFVVAYNLFPLFATSVNAAYAMGASASVLAITIAAATLVPDYRIGLLFIGSVPLKFIALATLLLDLLNISGTNAGGHIAHLGGALLGFIYIKQLRNGRDLGKGIEYFFDWIHALRKPTMKVHSFNARKRNDEDFLASKKEKQERIDEILDKISKSGYSSLSKDEKDFLFRAGKNGS